MASPPSAAARSVCRAPEGSAGDDPLHRVGGLEARRRDGSELCNVVLPNSTADTLVVEGGQKAGRMSAGANERTFSLCVSALRSAPFSIGALHWDVVRQAHNTLGSAPAFNVAHYTKA